MIEFRLRGTCVRLYFSFFAVICLFLQLSQGPSGPLCLLAAGIHELGHLMAFTALGLQPRSLSFHLGGIRLSPPDSPVAAWKELATLAGGAAMSFAWAAGSLAAGAKEPAAFHLLTGLFSLLPVRGLDGGEILSAVLERLWPAGGVRAAEKISLAFTLIGAAAALAIGLQTQKGGLLLLGAALLFCAVSG